MCNVFLQQLPNVLKHWNKQLRYNLAVDMI